MKYKIAILTTVANFELYHKTNPIFDSEYDRFVIDGRDGMHGIHSVLYMMKKFRKLDYDYVIMADEDFILQSNESIVDVIDEMEMYNDTIVGVRDGGVIEHRKYNPFCINTFFSIINIRRVNKIWNKREMLSNQKISVGEFQLNEALDYEYDELSLFEPYYCFYLWILRKGEKIKYLTSKPLEGTDDKITNVVYHKNKIVGFHSWYARSYGINKLQTERIDRLFKNVDLDNSSKVEYVIWKKRIFKYSELVRKFFRKIIIKLKWKK